jgi:hypothetical protein
MRKGPKGFSVFLHPGDHYLATRNHLFFVPYGDEIQSGDDDYHVCLHPTENDLNCFFAPPENVSRNGLTARENSAGLEGFSLGVKSGLGAAVTEQRAFLGRR